MAGPTISLGLTLVVPAVKGGRNWYDEFVTFTQDISSHDHTGAGNGTQISGSAIKLINNDYLQGTEFGGADADLITLNTADQITFGVYPVLAKGDILANTDVTHDIGSATAHFTSVFARTLQSTTGLSIRVQTNDTGSVILATNAVDRWRVTSGGDLLPELTNTYDIGSITLDATAVYTRSIRTNSGSSLRVLTDGGGDVILSTSATDRWRVDTATGNFSPELDEFYSIGSTSRHALAVFSKEFAASLGGSLVIGTRDAQQISFRTNGSTRWGLQSGGDFVPTTNNTYDIGDTNTDVGTVYTRAVRTDSGSSLRVYTSGGGDVILTTNGVDRWRVRSTAGLEPNVHNTYDFGSNSVRIRDIYTVGAVTTFSGAHIYVVDTTNVPAEGDAVKLVNRKVQKCTSASDPCCIGFVTGRVLAFDVDNTPVQDSFDTEYAYDSEGTNPSFVSVVAVGDSICSGLIGINICDEGGAVSDGDLLCTSSTAGYLMKQSDDIVRSYTVAQARESVSFDGGGEATGQYVFLLK